MAMYGYGINTRKRCGCGRSRSQRCIHGHAQLCIHGHAQRYIHGHAQRSRKWQAGWNGVHRKGGSRLLPPRHRGRACAEAFCAGAGAGRGSCTTPASGAPNASSTKSSYLRLNAWSGGRAGSSAGEGDGAGWGGCAGGARCGCCAVRMPCCACEPPRLSEEGVRKHSEWFQGRAGCESSLKRSRGRCQARPQPHRTRLGGAGCMGERSACTEYNALCGLQRRRRCRERCRERKCEACARRGCLQETQAVDASPIDKLRPALFHEPATV